MGVVPVLLEGFTFDGEHRDALGGDRRCSVILGGEDVAGGPAHFGPEFHQGLDQNGGLNRHVKGASDTGTFQGLLAAVLLAQRHQTGHLGLGDVEFLAAEVGLIDVGDDAINAELQLSRGRGRCHHGSNAP